MLTHFFLAALAAVVPLSCATTVPAGFTLARRIDDIDAVANDDMILEAFIEANHPDATPNRTMTEYGDWEMYSFDEGEWQAMRSSLLQKAGIDESALVARELEVRQNKQDAPVFFCKNRTTKPVAYTASLGAAVNGFCTAIVEGTSAVGRRFVSRRNQQDARPQAQNVGVIRATLSYTPKVLKWAVTGGCSIGLGIGVNQACEAIERGAPQGDQQATSAFTAENENLASSVTFTDIPG